MEPFLSSIWLKIGAVALLVGLLIGGYAYWHHTVYASGYSDGAKSVQDRWDAAVAADKKASEAKKTATEAKIAPIQSDAQAKIDSSVKNTPVIVKTVTRIVHDHPDFAQCLRPSELDGVRHDQLDQIAVAAGGYTPAPSSSAAASPGSSTGNGAPADGDHGNQ